MATVLLNREEIFTESILQKYSESCTDPKLYATCVLDFMLRSPFEEVKDGVKHTIDRIRVTNDAETNEAYAYYTTRLGYLSQTAIPKVQVEYLQAEINKLREVDIFLHDVDIDLLHFVARMHKSI